MTSGIRSIIPALLLLCLIHSPIPSAAQDWTPLREKPGVAVQDICILPGGIHGWAVGTVGAGGLILSAIFRTDDGGEHWETVPFPGETSVPLNGVDFVTPDVGWVVGNAGRIYKTTDGGASWTAQASGTSRKLAKICVLNESLGWATGGWQDGGTYLVLKTTNGGTNWTNQSFGSGAYSCGDIVFTDASNGWICGYDNTINGHIHRTTNGGTSWTRQTIPAGLGEVSSIDFASSTVGWASTSSIYAAPSGAVLHTTDGGLNWSVQTYTGRHYNYAIDAQDPNRVAVSSVQILSPQSERVFVTLDGGANWIERMVPIISYTFALQFVGEEIWLGTDFSQILASPDEGKSWAWQYRAALWSGMAWADAMNGWMTAGTSAGTDGWALRTTDGGSIWFLDSGAPGGADVDFVDAATGWMLWEGSASKVWRTTDGGGSWLQSSVGTGNWIGGITFATPALGWAFGSSGTIRRTTDGGVTWASQTSGTSNYVQDVHFVDALEGWAVGGYGGGGGFIRHTTNAGSNWLAQTPAAPDHFQSASFISNQTGWLVAVEGRVHRTTDGGATWQITGQVPHIYADKILMINENDGWVAARNSAGGAPGEDGRGFIYRTADGGATWHLEWEGAWPKASVETISIQSGRAGFWACGNHDLLLRYLAPGDALDLPARAFDLIAAPNPFRDEITIRFSTPAGGPGAIGIFDVSGRRVRSLARDLGGAGAVCWDGIDDHGKRLPSGVYLARLTADGKTVTRRICLAP